MTFSVKVLLCMCFVIVYNTHVVFVLCSNCVEKTHLETLYVDKELDLDDEEVQEFEGGEIENNFYSDPCVRSSVNLQNLAGGPLSNYNPLWDGSDIILGDRNVGKQRLLSKGNVIRCGIQNRYMTVTLISSVPTNMADSSDIVFISAKNLLQTSRGKARIQYGGVGCKYTSIQLRSQKSKGFSYEIEIYGS